MVGSFIPFMREVDDEALRISAIHVDTRGGALQEAGELVQGMQDGVIEESDIRGDLFQLTRKTCKGRQQENEVTLFKSVGSSLEDLAAAELAAAFYASHPQSGTDH